MRRLLTSLICQEAGAIVSADTIYRNVGATYVTLPYLTLQMIPAETASLLTDDNNCGFEKFGNYGLHIGSSPHEVEQAKWC